MHPFSSPFHDWPIFEIPARAAAKAACDGVMGSGKIEDVCGTCDGDIQDKNKCSKDLSKLFKIGTLLLLFLCLLSFCWMFLITIINNKKYK